MDPDIPVPSIENIHQRARPSTSKFATFRDTSNSPLLSPSPSTTPYKTPRTNPSTPAPIKISPSPSLSRNGHRSSPDLQPKRSPSSLSVARGQTPAKLQLRRVSSNLNPASPAIAAKATDIMPSQSPPQTTSSADSVAKAFFQRELRTHADGRSTTAVIVHDACYGHRFARPRTSKAALSTIVERPERIHATVLGAATAYVRLGDRHTEGAYGPHPATDINTLPSPPFLLQKTNRLIPLNHPAVTNIHGTKWMEELQIMCDSAESKLSMNGKELSRPIGYGKDEDGNTLPKLHEGDLYLCSESLLALQGCLGGVCDAVDVVFSPSVTTKAFVCIRPPGHHCSANYPSGFCWLNNVHVGISYAAMNHGLTHAAIVDFDLHHGDGSQTITWDHNRRAQTLPKNAAQFKKTPIGYYSLHDINSYPCEWGDEEKVRNASLCIDNAHGQSIWNVHLEPWTSLEHFWQLYETKYSVLLEKTKLFLQHHSEKLRASGIVPKGAIFLSAGFDASQWEGQGMQRHNVNIPTEFYARFTSDIAKLAEQLSLGVDGRIISVLEGGYSDRALMSGVFSHLCGLTCCESRTSFESSGYGTISTSLGMQQTATGVTPTSVMQYEPDWWSEDNLEAIESRVAGIIVAPPKKKDKVAGNYSSPTHASTARMTDVARERKSSPAQFESRTFPEWLEPEPPQPVDWITAAYELSRILIPDSRQTTSYQHEELNAESTKVRRERQSAIGVAAPPEPRMQLRTRGKGLVNEPDNVRIASRTSNRRTTIAAVSELPDPLVPTERPRRRSSAASSILSGFQDMRLNDSHMDDGSADLRQQTSALPDFPRKTKMGPAAKRAASKVSSPRKSKAAAQPAIRVAASAPKPQDGKGESAVSHASIPHIDVASPTYRDDMGDLTNGTKKVSIKLKMPTFERHAENLERAEETKVKKPRVLRKPPVPKVARAKPTAAVPVIVPDMPLPQSVSNGSFIDVPALYDNQFNSLKAVSGSSVRITKTSSDSHGTVNEGEHQPVPAVEATQNVGLDMHAHSDYKPKPRPLTTSQQTPEVPLSGTANAVLTAAQPVSDNGQTLARRTMVDLPMFTANSPIPFSQTSNLGERQVSSPKDGSSLWEVPETPRH